MWQKTALWRSLRHEASNVDSRVQQARIELYNPEIIEIETLTVATKNILIAIAPKDNGAHLVEEKEETLQLLVSAFGVIDNSLLAADYGYTVASEAVDLAKYLRDNSNPNSEEISEYLKSLITFASEGRQIAEKVQMEFNEIYEKNKNNHIFSEFNECVKGFAKWWNFIKLEEGSLEYRANLQYDVKLRGNWGKGGIRTGFIQEKWNNLKEEFRRHSGEVRSFQLAKCNTNHFQKLSPLKIKYKEYFPPSTFVTPNKTHTGAIKSLTLIDDEVTVTAPDNTLHNPAAVDNQDIRNHPKPVPTGGSDENSPHARVVSSSNSYNANSESLHERSADINYNPPVSTDLGATGKCSNVVSKDDAEANDAFFEVYPTADKAIHDDNPSPPPPSSSRKSSTSRRPPGVIEAAPMVTNSSPSGTSSHNQAPESQPPSPFKSPHKETVKSSPSNEVSTFKSEQSQGPYKQSRTTVGVYFDY
ncbi:hypothetical protein BDQ17DRAFT_1331619 [Cyathus striatus]|nr:hypothetical protein BDQ17DRAFT_1331619 [Cyathus striatus]